MYVTFGISTGDGDHARLGQTIPKVLKFMDSFFVFHCAGFSGFGRSRW